MNEPTAYSISILSRYLWQIWEEGKVDSLMSGLERGPLARALPNGDALGQGEFNGKIVQLVHFFRETKGTHDAWAGI